MEVATGAQAAQHIDLSERRFRELLDSGAVTRARPGKYDLAKVRVQYIRNLRKLAAGHGAGSPDLARERALLAREQRGAVKIKNQLSHGVLVRVSEVAAFVKSEYSVVREILLNIPGTHSYEIAAAARESPDLHSSTTVVTKLLGEYIYDALTALSDPQQKSGSLNG
jgi:phage terminase Nu1 subunit (DNA packaging protein)